MEDRTLKDELLNLLTA